MPPTSTSRDLRFLDPAVIARLGTMELKARTVVEGFLSGLHRSPYKGFSVEFAEYRQYLPGDDLSTLDWKVYARTDRHYVKKFEEETNLECHLLLDVSASMAYRGAAPMSKLEYGSVLAASLAFLMNRQRDATGLIAFDDHDQVPPACRRTAGTPARAAARARSARAGIAVERRRPAPSARGGARQAQPRRACVRSARRSGAGHQGTQAPAVPRHRRRGVPGAGSGRADVPVPGRLALPGSRERHRGDRGPRVGADRVPCASWRR